MKKIEIHKSYRHGNELYHAGTYRVPADLSEDLATRAVQSGIGNWVLEPQPITKTEPPATAPVAATAPRRGRPPKSPAPENKAISGSPEDKYGETFPDESEPGLE